MSAPAMVSVQREGRRGILDTQIVVIVANSCAQGVRLGVRECYVRALQSDTALKWAVIWSQWQLVRHGPDVVMEWADQSIRPAGKCQDVIVSNGRALPVP